MPDVTQDNAQSDPPVAVSCPECGYTDWPTNFREVDASNGYGPSSRPISPPSPAETPDRMAPTRRFVSAVRRAFNSIPLDRAFRVAVQDAIVQLNAENAALPPIDEPRLIQSAPTETQTATPDDESLDFIFGGTDRIREAQSASPRAAQPATTALTDDDRETLRTIAAAYYLASSWDASSKLKHELLLRLASTPSPTTPEAPAEDTTHG